MNEINDNMIVKHIIVNCTLEKVWWKWTTHEGLLTFFGSDNNIDFRVGGSYEIYFLLDNPERLRGGEGNKIISYIPREMLSFTWNAPPEYPDVRNHEHKTWVVVYFNAISENLTEITLKHVGWLNGDEWDKVFEYFESAWERVLEWLGKSCNDDNQI